MPDPEKYCGHCGEQLERKRFNGRLEDLGAFKKRIYCSRACMANGYVKDAPLIGTYRWRASKLRGTCCEVCGAKERLHAHHIDGNVSNNSHANIQTLCISCHVSHHHRVRRAGLTVPGRAA